MSDDLILQARKDYGELIVSVVRWPPGLGIDVHLVGGDVVQYDEQGGRFLVHDASASTKIRRRMAALRGAVRRLLFRP